jgi:hypothetical protein
VMHCGSVDHNLRPRRAQTSHYRFQTGKFNVLVRKRTNFVALIRKSADYIMAELTIGPDHRDLQANLTDGFTEMEIVIDRPSTRVRLPDRNSGSCLNQANAATLPGSPRCGLCRRQPHLRAAIE